ncbi:MAG: hypothetical protein ABIE14_03940 [Patescibacteria group bacterium]
MQQDNKKQNYAEIFDAEQEAESAIGARFKGIYTLLWAIGGTLVVAVIAMIVTVVGLVVDSWRWKSNSYNEMVRVMDTKNQELQKERFNEIEEQLNNLQGSINQIPTSLEEQDAGIISD